MVIFRKLEARSTQLFVSKVFNPLFRFVCITDDPALGRIYDKAGVTDVMIDLEAAGKAAQHEHEHPRHPGKDHLLRRPVLKVAARDRLLERMAQVLAARVAAFQQIRAAAGGCDVL